MGWREFGVSSLPGSEPPTGRGGDSRTLLRSPQPPFPLPFSWLRESQSPFPVAAPVTDGTGIFTRACCCHSSLRHMTLLAGEGTPSAPCSSWKSDGFMMAFSLSHPPRAWRGVEGRKAQPDTNTEKGKRLQGGWMEEKVKSKAGAVPGWDGDRELCLLISSSLLSPIPIRWGCSEHSPTPRLLHLPPSCLKTQRPSPPAPSSVPLT